jgi:hypothetical protein
LIASTSPRISRAGNPVLDSKCYVRSTLKPDQSQPTFGTAGPPPPNEPISGTPPTVTNDSALKILHLDNSFSAPGASGCTLTLLGFLPIGINASSNSQSGLPAAAGTNETVQNGNVEIVSSKPVYP